MNTNKAEWILIGVAVLLLIGWAAVFTFIMPKREQLLGATTFNVQQGGTGSTTLSGILKGNNTSAVGTVVIGSNLSWDGTTLSATGGGSGFSTSSAAYWLQNGAVFSTTTQNFFTQYNNFSSLFATISSTTNSTTTGSLYLTALSAGTLNLDSNNKVYSTGTSTPSFTAPLSYSGTPGQFIGGSSGALSIPNSTNTVDGYLSAINFAIFNMKVATSASETAGQLAVWGTTAGSPAKLYSIATSTPTVTAPITYSGTLGNFVGGSSGAFDCTSASNTTKGCITAADHLTFASHVATGTPFSANQFAYTNNSGLLVTVASSSLNLPNTALQNSTISGIALGSNLNSHSTNSSLTGTSYNGSAAVSDWGINLANSNTFSIGQIFQASSTIRDLTTITATSSTLFVTGSTTFMGNASTSGTFWANNASSTKLWGANLSQCNGANQALNWNAGLFTCASISVSGSVGNWFTPTTAWSGRLANATDTPIWFRGTSGPASAFGTSTLFDFGTTTSATSTNLKVSGWFMASASSTIGAGGLTTGLTISGGSTTTKTAYFQSYVGIGSTTPSALWGVSIATSTVFTSQFGGFFASSSSQAATYTIDWETGNTQRFILNQNTNFVINATSSHPRDGFFYKWLICQDSVGGRTATVVTPGQVIWGQYGTTTIQSTAKTGTWIGMVYDARVQRYTVLASSTPTDTRVCIP